LKTTAAIYKIGHQSNTYYTSGKLQVYNIVENINDSEETNRMQRNILPELALDYIPNWHKKYQQRSSQKGMSSESFVGFEVLTVVSRKIAVF
jgi:hypothetical protein